MISGLEMENTACAWNCCCRRAWNFWTKSAMTGGGGQRGEGIEGQDGAILRGAGRAGRRESR